MRVLGVFAHNESTRIQRCLESIESANPDRDLRCIVLANGCTDNTADVARNHAYSRKWIEVKEIAVGDKANAWNLFVHEIAAKSDIYFFMDGDCMVQAGAFQALEQALALAPLANAATGIPRRTLTSFGGFRRSLMKNPGVAGNLYALPLQFIKRIKLANVRLPVGLVGDDSLVGALACWDLDPSKKNWDFNRIVVVHEAEFGYDSILSSTFGAPLFYPRRCVRYSLRHFQNQLLGRRLKQLGLDGIPRIISDAYTPEAVEQLSPRPGVVQYLFDRLALLQIHASMLQKPEVKGF